MDTSTESDNKVIVFFPTSNINDFRNAYWFWSKPTLKFRIKKLLYPFFDNS